MASHVCREQTVSKGKYNARTFSGPSKKRGFATCAGHTTRSTMTLPVLDWTVNVAIERIAACMARFTMLMPRVLITGGAGFIGSHLADELLQYGYTVRVLDCLIPQVHGP